MKNELSKQKEASVPWTCKLPPKTKAELLMEKEEAIKRDNNRRYLQILKLAHEAKQLDVFSHTYKKFESKEELLEWLQDVLEEKKAGFEVEDDDTREKAWQQEKENRMRKGLNTNADTHVAEYKAKKFFFESNQFLSQPLRTSLIKKDTCGKLNEDEKFELGMQVLKLKFELKQEKHTELNKQSLGKQLSYLHNLKKTKKHCNDKAYGKTTLQEI